jgi:hypothetical protein
VSIGVLDRPANADAGLAALAAQITIAIAHFEKERVEVICLSFCSCLSWGGHPGDASAKIVTL